MDRDDLARLLGASPRSAEPSGEPLVIDERDPGRFMEAFATACGSGTRVFLADPDWSEAQRRQFHTLLRQPMKPGGEGRGWLMIPSGGSSGGLKFSRHDEGTILAAVRGFCGHFGIMQVNAIGLLPLWHVSGLSAWMRSVLTGGTYLPWSWKDIEEGRYPEPAPDGSCLSLVPTQLQRLVGTPAAVAWLRRFSQVFIGGAPLWPELADQAAALKLPLSLGYGMTETFAMAAALTPDQFLSGDRTSGTALPHAAIDLTSDGRVRIHGESVHHGYYPEWNPDRSFTTEDLGDFTEKRQLRLLGRRDALIITGGKKVDPAQVEAVLRGTGLFADVAVVGVADPHWGEAVTACYPASQAIPDGPRLEEALRALAPHQRPKRFIAVGPWPRNAQGKVNRADLKRAATAARQG